MYDVHCIEVGIHSCTCKACYAHACDMQANWHVGILVCEHVQMYSCISLSTYEVHCIEVGKRSITRKGM